MKILYVITKASWGGAQRYVYDLAVAMKKDGHDVAVAYGEDGPLQEKLAGAGVRAIAIPSLSRDVKFSAELSAFKELRTLIRAEHPDILHVNSSKAGLALLAARVEQVPRILFTAHGWAFNERRPWWQKLLLRAIYAFTVYLPHETICVSDAIRRDISFSPGVRLRVIRHGIDAPAFLSREEAREKLAPALSLPFWLGIVAELHPTKRVEDALAAFAELAREYPDMALVVIGEGELRTWLESVIVHYGLQDRVVLAGFIPDAARYLRAFDLFILPSRSEALAYALIEAGYASLPAVATRVGGIPEVVQHKKSGLLVPAENPHALARALRTLLLHPEEASAYGAALKMRVEELFSKDRMLEETRTVYGFTASV